MRLATIGNFTAILFVSLAVASESNDKLPIPDDAVQKQASVLIANLFKDEYDSAKTPEQRSELAKKLLQLGIDSKDDATGRYVLLRIAKDVAADAGDSVTALQAIEHLEDSYKVDALAMKAETLAKIVKSLKTPQAHQELASTLQGILNEAIAEDRFDIAKQVHTAALESARQVRSADLVRQVAAQGKNIDELAAEFEKVQSAHETLKTLPTDSEANLLVGKYLCFIKEDWESGLLMLALSNDPKLKSLAESELKGAPDALKLGDSWWDVAETLSGLPQENVRRFAVYYYRQTLPQLTGLTKARVEKRIKEVPKDERVAGSLPNANRRGTTENPKYTLGLVAELFNDTKFERRIKSRIDSTIDFNWESGRPDPDINADHFGIRWRGYLKPPKPGRYTIVIKSDNGVRISLNGKTIVDKLSIHGQHQLTAVVDLTDGYHSIQIEFLEGILTAWCHLRWFQHDGFHEQVIGAEHLFHDLQQKQLAGLAAVEPTVEKANEPHVIAVWEHRASRTSQIKFYSNGKINDPNGSATWHLNGQTLILRWPNRSAPGGVWIDTCTVSADGKSYEGKNQRGVTIRGRLISLSEE